MRANPFSLSAQLVASKYVKPGLLQTPDGTLFRGYRLSLLPSGSFEGDFEGPAAISLFERFGELLSKLPTATNFQLILLRSAVSAGDGATGLGSLATGENQDPAAGSTLFVPVGFTTSFYLIEQDAGATKPRAAFGAAAELSLAPTPIDESEYRQILARFFGSHVPNRIPDVVWERNHLRSGNKHLKVASLTELPQTTWPACLQALFEFPEEFVLSIKLRVPERAAVIRSLDTRRRVSHALSVNSSAELRNIESNSTLDASEEQLERMTIGKESLFDMSLAFIVGSRNLTRATEICQQIEREASSVSSCGLFTENIGSLPVFRSHLPGQPIMPLRMLPILSGNLAHMLPLVFDYNRSNTPTRLQLVSRCGEASTLNFFSPENINFNAFICGASGSGKSFLMNSLLAAFTKDHPRHRVAIFDVGGSYKKLVKALGGQTVALTSNSARSLISTFLSKLTIESSGFFKSFVENLCGAGSHITHSHRVAIDDLLECCAGAPFRVKTLRLEALERTERPYQDIALWLKPHLKLDETESSRAFENVLASNVTAFDFKALDAEPELQRLTILVLTHKLWKELANAQGLKTLIVFDEVWKFFAQAQGFLEELYRTLRKYSAGIVSITQNLSDYGDDAFARLIVSTSNTHILLQNGANAQTLQKMLDLDEPSVACALSIQSKKPEFSEFYIRTPTFSQVCRLFASPDLYQLAHTEGIQEDPQAMEAA